MTEGEVIDIRGEPCGMPVLRVEKFIEAQKLPAVFTVIGDYPQTLDQLQLLAMRLGWTFEAGWATESEWRAVFRPPTRPWALGLGP